jgi:hypothetical protein
VIRPSLLARLAFVAAPIALFAACAIDTGPESPESSSATQQPLVAGESPTGAKLDGLTPHKDEGRSGAANPDVNTGSAQPAPTGTATTTPAPDPGTPIEDPQPHPWQPPSTSPGNTSNGSSGPKPIK